MNTACCLLIGALALGQATSRSEWQLAPQLAAGLELVYEGMYTEETLIPNVQFQRQYRIEARIFVLDTPGRHFEAAFMTALTPRLPNPGSKENKPGSVRLEIATIDSQGKLASRSGAVLLPPLDGPPLLETGCIIELPRSRLAKDSVWEVNEEGRPPRSWRVLGLDTSAGVTCVKIVGQQQSYDWDQPRADHTAWRRHDTILVNPKLGVAERVERVIERRDPARREPTHRLTVRYELSSPLRYTGRLFEDRKAEILKAKRFHDDAAAMLRQPAQYRPQLDTLIKRVSLHVENQAPTPYRKAVFHLAARLESARRGDTPPELIGQETPAPRTAAAIGQRIADFVVTDITGQKSVRLSRLLGRPLVVIFYNPTTDLGRDVMYFARGLLEKHEHRMGVMAMAVTDRTEDALKQQRDLQLPFEILDGHGMRLTFGADATPRLVLLDAEGVVHTMHTGWGPHVPREIEEELGRLLKK
jgi:peroxiredoxin